MFVVPVLIPSIPPWPMSVFVFLMRPTSGSVADDRRTIDVITGEASASRPSSTRSAGVLVLPGFRPSGLTTVVCVSPCAFRYVRAARRYWSVDPNPQIASESA